MHTPQPEDEPLSGILPMDELEERFGLLQKFMKRIHKIEPGFQLSSTSLVSFYILPLRKLRYRMKNDKGTSGAGHYLPKVERAAYRFINLSATGSEAQSRLTSESSESLPPETASKRKATEELQSSSKRANTRPAGSSVRRSMPPGIASHDARHEPEDDSEDGSGGEGNWRMARLPTDLLRTPPKLKSTPEEVQLCLERDGRRCVVTGSRIAQAAHIVRMGSYSDSHAPFEDQDEDRFELFRLALSLEFFDIPLLKFRSFCEPWARSNEPGNMISLSPSLHRAWSEGYFGLKPIGLAPFLDGKVRMGEVAFQFVWLPRASYKAFTNPVDMCKEHPNDPESLVAQLRGSARPEGLHFMNAKTNGPAKSGDFFHVNRPYEEAQKLKELLAIQWTLVRIAAMSGAADAVQYGLDTLKDQNRVVIPWLADQFGRHYDPEDIEYLQSEAHDSEDVEDLQSEAHDSEDVEDL